MPDEKIHSLYCPECDAMVGIPYATEISERNCPLCGAGANTLWPSKEMYDRDQAHNAARAVKAYASADAIVPKEELKSSWLKSMMQKI